MPLTDLEYTELSKTVNRKQNKKLLNMHFGGGPDFGHELLQV